MAILVPVGLDDYTLVLYRQDDAWVAEIPAIGGGYALMPTRDEALHELRRVFEMIEEEYREQGRELPADTTEIVNAERHGARVPTGRIVAGIHLRSADRQPPALETSRRPHRNDPRAWQSFGRSALFFKILRQLGVTPQEFDALR